MASAIELGTGYLTLAASTQDLAKQLGGMFRGAETEASKTGVKMGKAIAKGFDAEKPDVDKLAAEVERAEQRVAAQAEQSARKQEAAKRKVDIAQAKVNETTEKYGAKSSQALSAVDRLATAEQKLEMETKAAADAQGKFQRELESSEKALKDARDSVDRTAKTSEGASKTYAKGWKGVGQRVKDELNRGVKGATKSAEKQAESGGRRAGGGFSSAFKGAIGGLAAGFSIGAVTSFVKDSVDLAGAAEQSVGAIDTVFKDNARVMHEWAASSKKAVGISANEYRELGTLLGSQLKNMGTPMDELADKTNGLIGMGADMASMFGGTTKEAIEAISSALKGEMDPIERYGVTLSAAALEAEALSKGIIKPVVDSGKVEDAATKMSLAQNKYNETLKKYGKDSDEAKRARLQLTSAENAYEKATAGKVPKLEGEAKALAVQSALYAQSADAQGNFMREEDTFEHKRQVALASWADLKETLGNAFLPALTGVFAFVGDTAIPALQSFGGWVQQNQAWLKPLAVTLLSMGGTMLAFRAVIPIVLGLTNAVALFKDGFKALNLVMKANVIGLIVAAIVGLVAGFMYLWNTNEAFRNFWIATWNHIKNFFLTIWSSYLKPAFQALANFWTNTLAPAIKWAWESIVKPVFAALGSFFKWVWESVLKPAFAALVWYWKNILAPALRAVWENVVKPVFRALGDFFSWVWKSVLKPAFSAVKNTWKSLSDSIKYVYETFIKPVFDVFGKLLKGDFVGAFQTAKDAVAKIWDDIKGVVKKPIEFVVNKVINDGLIGAFNKVTGFIDPEHKVIPKIGNVSLPKGFATGGWTGPGHKYKPAGVVHADEFVVRKESQRSIERNAPGFLDGLNRFGAKALGYATGGLVRPVKGGRITSGFGASRGRYPHAGLDLAVPVGTPVFASMDGRVSRAGWNAITGRSGIGAFLDHEGGRNTYYGHLSKLLVKVGDMVRKGQQIAVSGNTGRSTGPHLHWETWTGGKAVNPAPYLSGAMLPVGGVGGGGGGFNPLQALVDFKDSIIGKFRERFPNGGMFSDLAQGAGSKLTGDILGWFPAQMAKIGDFAQDTWGNVKDFFNGPDSAVKSAVRGVAAGYGWDSGRHWNALNTLIGKESSWDPNAQNKGSTAYGLFQFLNSTWSSVGAAKTSDPAGQARAGLKYIQQRYGDPEKAWAFWKRNNWYADGGLVTPTLFDGGGWLHNTGSPQLIEHRTRKPDAVLTNSQWEAVMKSIEVSHTVAEGRSTATYQIEKIELPPRATVDDLTTALRFEERRLARGGARR